jgi:hypothetical protein
MSEFVSRDDWKPHTCVMFSLGIPAIASFEHSRSLSLSEVTFSNEWKLQTGVRVLCVAAGNGTRWSTIVRDIEY